jgi:hypothetical protein
MVSMSKVTAMQVVRGGLVLDVVFKSEARALW